MSQALPETNSPLHNEENAPSIQMARFTIHCPLRDNNKKQIPHVLAALRKQLTASGFSGRTVMQGQGDWNDYDTEEMALVMVDTEDTPENLQAMKTLSQGVKQAAGQEAVYLTVQPMQTYLI